jgi:ABC-type sugar transport system ATPase subunit
MGEHGAGKSKLMRELLGSGAMPEDETDAAEAGSCASSQ